MNQVNTTLPLPVTGQQLNDTFPAEASLQQQQIAKNLQIFTNALDVNKNMLYLNDITIANTDLPKSRIFQLNTLNPFKSKVILYRKTDSYHLAFIPWYAVQAYFSSLGNYDVEIVFRPKKVNDSRLILDVLFSYSAEPMTTTNSDNWFQNDGMTFNIDSIEDEFKIDVPMYSILDNFPFRKHFFLDSEGDLTERKPIFFPNVNMSVYIRSPYQPNSIQPDEMKIQVYVNVKFKGLQKYVLPGFCRQIYAIEEPVTNTSISYPFWMDSDTF